MQIRVIPDEGIPDEEQVAVGYSVDDEAAVPPDDDADWWLPNEAEMTGPNAIWRNCGGQWTPKVD